MIDLHCHILPGVDDGPATLEESIEMCRMASADGTSTIVAATHFRPGSYTPTVKALTERTAELRAALASASIPITIVPAAEVTVTPELSENLSTCDWLFVNGGGKYFIAEFGSDVVPSQWLFLFSPLLRSGRIPIITHPERCSRFADHPEELRDFVEKGGLVQITAMSLTGELGEDLQSFTEDLLRGGLAHIIASDGHAPHWRPPLLSAAVERAAAVVGREKALSMVFDTPAAIIEGRSLSGTAADLAPEIPKRRSWFKRMVS